MSTMKGWTKVTLTSKAVLDAGLLEPFISVEWLRRKKRYGKYWGESLNRTAKEQASCTTVPQKGDLKPDMLILYSVTY